jgi:hypothetical protein
MPKQHNRKLWLQIRARGVTDRRLLRDTLIASIQRGDYLYPAEWQVQILWRNRDDADMRVGEFTEEMHASRLSSGGWDKAVLSYLRGLRA